MDLIKIIQISDDKTYNSGIKMLQQLMDVPSNNFVSMAKKLFDMYGIIDANGKLTKNGEIINQFSSLPLNSNFVFDLCI